MKVKNPILRGFHPEPSIIRVGDDYYIAMSTFEWWPGIRISHSRDLAHWETLTYILQDEELIVEQSKALEQAERANKRPKRAFEMSR